MLFSVFVKKLMNKLDSAFRRFSEVLEADPTSERPLDALISLEEMVEKMLEIKAIRDEVRGDISRVSDGDENLNQMVDDFLLKEYRVTIGVLLDKCHDRAMAALEQVDSGESEDTEAYCKRLNMLYSKVNKLIGEPIEMRGGVMPGEEDYVEKELVSSKLQILLEILREVGVFTDDLVVIEGTNRENMMRKGSYLYIEIPRVERSILLHQGYGEATFVLGNIFRRDEVFAMTKEQWTDVLRAKKIAFFEGDVEKWKSDMLTALDSDFGGEKIDMESYERRMMYMDKIRELYPDPAAVMGMTKKERKRFSLYGRGVSALYMIVCGETMCSMSAYYMAKMCQKIYGEGIDCIECELWGREEWMEKMRELYLDPAVLMGMTPREKGGIKLYGKGLKALYTIVCGEGGNPTTYPRDMAKMCQKIYGEGIECIESELWDREVWMEKIREVYPDPAVLMGIGDKEKVKIYGKGFIAIYRIVCGETGDPNNYSRDMAKMCREIYGEGIECIESELWDREVWIEKIRELYPDPAVLMGMTAKEKGKIKLYGKGLKAFYNIVCGETGDPVGYSRNMAKMCREIYGEEIDCIESELWDREVWMKKIREVYPDPYVLMTMTNKQKLGIILYGKRLTAIYRIVCGEKGAPAVYSQDMVKLCREIYGEGIDCIECELWGREEWMEKVREAYSDPEVLMSLTAREKRGIKLYGKGLSALYMIVCGEKGRPERDYQDMAKLCRAIYGEVVELD